MLDKESALELFLYDPLSGSIYWATRKLKWFKSCRGQKTWNKRYANTAVGSLDGYGYLQTRVLGVNYRVHRIVWLMYYGDWPKGQIDHINGVKTDNRICNLRCVSLSDNQKNKPLYKNNKSGYNGVYQFKGSWLASIKHEGVSLHLGCFANKQDAITARKAAEKKYGFHENHGR